MKGSVVVNVVELRVLTARPDTATDEAFTDLVRRQSRFVFRVANSVLRKPEDAEDAAQETFLKLYRCGSWREMDDEKAFLARAVWRIAVGRLPKGRSSELPNDLPSSDLSPEAAAMAGQRDALIHLLVDSLSEELRLPLALSSVEEMNSREIARIMGLPESTVRTRLMRARQTLKQKLAAMIGDRRHV